MRYYLVVALFLAAIQALFAQNVTLTVKIVDAANGETLIGAGLAMPALRTGRTSDENGIFHFEAASDDSLLLLATYVGYQTQTLTILPAKQKETLIIKLAPDDMLEEVTVSTTRTSSRIEDLAVKVEVLGLEELDEEASLVPGGMGSLLGDLSVITIQRTGAVSGNDAVRMQGLAPGYTQLLQDGLPLYGGFSGSLGVLNIPPLDLRQVEIIKGSSSTLYGGGAIGGLINFLSKTPGKKPQSTLLLNQTSLGETDANAFFSRKLPKNQGITLLAAGNLKPARDLNKDGFAEIAGNRQWMLHPRYFWGMGQKTSGDVGVSFARNQLEAGDFDAIRAGTSSPDHPFYQKETAQRLTGNAQISSQLSSNALWTLRGAGSLFKRDGNYAGWGFTGRQFNAYLESNVVIKRKKDDWVFGANFISEQFDLIKATVLPAFGDFNAQTFGIFAQNDHRFSSKWTLQTGFRLDKHERYGSFALPRASVLFKPFKAFSARLGYGRGYKTPDLFSISEPVDLQRLQPLGAAVRPDLANSLNADINYSTLIAEKLSLQVNQALYYVGLAHPFEVTEPGPGILALQNTPGKGRVWGTDTYIQLVYKELELYFGFNHTLSERRLEDGTKYNEPYNPQTKIAATLAWSIPGKWRFGLESAYTARQFVEANRRVPSYWFWAAMVSRKFSWGLLVLNCENVGNARQSQHGALVSGTLQQPVFAGIWGPIEGRVLNLSLKIDW